MATKVYLRSFPGGINAETWCGVLPYPRPARGASSTGDSASPLSTTYGNQVQSFQNYTMAGPADLILVEYVSQPFSGDVTISGTITFNIWGWEGDRKANAGLKVNVYRVDCTTDTTTLIVSSARGTELGTSSTVQNWTASPASTLCHKGDLLFIQVRCTDTGGTMASGYAVTITTDGGTTGSDGDSYVSFTETLSFSSGTPSGTQVFLTNSASDLSVSDTALVLGFARGAGSTTASRSSMAGPISPTQYLISGSPVRWYTPPLTAGTVNGPVRVNLRAYASGVAYTTSVVVDLIKRTLGGTETTLGRGAWNWGGRESTSDSGTGIPNVITFGISDTVLADGDRLGIVVYIDDAMIGLSESGRTNYLSYSGTTVGEAGDSWMQLSSAITAYIAGIPNTKVFWI